MRLWSRFWRLWLKNKYFSSNAPPLAPPLILRGGWGELSFSLCPLWQNYNMISFRKELFFNIPERVGFVNITSQVTEALKESGIREGRYLGNGMQFPARV